MKITYLHHNGFSVELDENILVFDYYTEHGKYDDFNPADYNDKKITVFTSHRHSDHFDERIKNWDNVSYVNAFDVPEFHTDRSIVVEANKNYNFNDLDIRTFLSNDEGVAFLVTVENKIIYHSGDLNWWDWESENKEFRDGIEASFKKEINELIGINIDVAFLPVDLRLGDSAFLCCEYFVEYIFPKNIFPMHFWGDFSASKKVIEHCPDGNIFNITEIGCSFELD